MKKVAIAFILLASIGLAAFTIQAMMQRKGAMLNHVALSVVNLDQSTRFYRDIIQVDNIPEPFHDGKHSWFKIGEHSQLHIIQAAKEKITHDKSAHLCFSVPNIDDFIARLEKAKVDYGNWLGDSKTPTTRPDGIKQIFLQDPDGYWIEINNDRY